MLVGGGTNDAQIIGARCLQRPFRRLPRRPRRGQRRLGLGDVGAGDLAHPEPVIGRLQLAGEHLLVVDLEREQLLVLDHRDIGTDRLLEDLLLGGDELGPLGEHVVLGLGHLAMHLAARKQRLGEGGLGEPDVARVIKRGRRPRRQVEGLGAVAIARLALGDDLRPPAGERLGDVLIDRTQMRPLRKQRRVGRIGGDQRLGQRPGQRPLAEEGGRQRRIRALGPRQGRPIGHRLGLDLGGKG